MPSLQNGTASVSQKHGVCVGPEGAIARRPVLHHPRARAAQSSVSVVPGVLDRHDEADRVIAGGVHVAPEERGVLRPEPRRVDASRTGHPRAARCRAGAAAARLVDEAVLVAGEPGRVEVDGADDVAGDIARVVGDEDRRVERPMPAAVDRLDEERVGRRRRAAAAQSACRSRARRGAARRPPSGRVTP